MERVVTAVANAVTLVLPPQIESDVDAITAAQSLHKLWRLRRYGHTRATSTANPCPRSAPIGHEKTRRRGAGGSQKSEIRGDAAKA